MGEIKTKEEFLEEIKIKELVAKSVYLEYNKKRKEIFETIKKLKKTLLEYDIQASKAIYDEYILIGEYNKYYGDYIKTIDASDFTEKCMESIEYSWLEEIP